MNTDRVLYVERGIHAPAELGIHSSATASCMRLPLPHICRCFFLLNKTRVHLPHATCACGTHHAHASATHTSPASGEQSIKRLPHAACICHTITACTCHTHIAHRMHLSLLHTHTAASAATADTAEHGTMHCTAISAL